LENEEVSKRLVDIQHLSIDDAIKNNKFAYAFDVDQNIVNSLVGHLNIVKKQVSVRKLIAHFDKEGNILNKMETNTLKINMPKIANDYGNRPFELSFSFDQELYMKQYPDAKPSGLYFDGQGNIKYQ